MTPLNRKQIAAVRELCDEEKDLGAVKVVRDKLGCSLREAHNLTREIAGRDLGAVTFKSPLPNS